MRMAVTGVCILSMTTRKMNTVSQHGIIFMREEIIGDCRLILGDCLEVMEFLDSVDHVITDPPYEDEYQETKAKIKRTDGRKMAGDTFSDALGFLGISTIRGQLCEKVSKINNGWFIGFCIAEGVRPWRDSLQQVGFKYDTALAWIKPDAMPRFNGQGAARGFECAVTSWCGKGHRKWNAGGKRGVYTHCVNTDRQGEHPTEKPLPLMVEILKDFTRPGETILDPFMGSGTTGVACVKLQRKFIGIELNEKYFDLSCRRIEEAYKQPDLFIESPVKHIQDKMI